MDLSNVSFSNFATAQVQGLLRAFNGLESRFEIVDGAVTPHRNYLDGAFIAEHFGCGQDMADLLLAELIGGGYLDAGRLAPLPKGMGLANDKGLPRISRAEAEKIVEALVAAAVAVNSRPGARVFVASLDVFGSFVSDKPTLGDVDVRLITVVDGEDQPEDQCEMEEIEDMLQVSDYVSFTGEYDRVAANAEQKRIFTRGQ